MVKIPEECPFPTIVKNALKNLFNKEGASVSCSIPRLNKKARDEIRSLEMINIMLRRNNEALQIRNTELLSKLKEQERKILSLQEDNAILRSLVRKLKNELKKYERWSKNIYI